jgi:2-succinyl-6-hydroxy-2,4-cyclohexadiene-1-carboxylate synthase
VAVESWVFVDGFTQVGGAWRPVARAAGLSGAFHAPPESSTFTEAAYQLGWSTRFLEREHRLERTVYAGYSQGGRLCLQLGLDRPDVVDGLVLVSASPGIADRTERAARRDADEVLATEIEREGVDAFLDRWLAQPLFATLPPERAGLDERRAANSVERLTRQLRVLGQGVQPPSWDRLGELEVPVLLVVGALDAKYVDIAERMATAIPRARLEVVADAGHACHLEQPEHVAQLLLDWSSAL